MPFRGICIVVFLAFAGKGFAQPRTGICSNPPAGSVKGDFDIDVFNICNPMTIKVIDKSGGENIRYNFYYNGESAAALNPDIPFRDRNSYVGYTLPTLETILQYGTKDGKPMYACKNIVVKQSNSVKYSYVVCSNSSVQISIPKDSLFNDYDNYEIRLDARTMETISAADLPFEKTYDTRIPARITVIGRYADPLDRRSCPNPVRDQLAQSTFLPSSNGVSAPFLPNLSYLFLSEPNLIFTFTGVYDKLYDIFQRDIDGQYTNSPLAKDLKPELVHRIKINNPEKQQCFYLRRQGSTCADQRSPEICTVPIFQVERQGDKHIINHSTYPNSFKDRPNNAQDGFNLVLEEQPAVNVFENNRTIASISSKPSNTIAEYTPLNCSKEHCYQYRLKISGQFNRASFSTESISNRFCYDPSLEELPITFSAVSTVEDSLVKIQIDPIGNDGLHAPEYYYIYKQFSGNAVLLDSMASPLTEYLTKDKAGVETNCYKIRAKDKCGSSSSFTDEICSIFLTFENNEELVWSKKSPFLEEVQKYDLLFEPVGSGTGLTNSYQTFQNSVFTFGPIPNDPKFGEEVRFRISATNREGNLVSLSNIVKRELPPKVTIPSAFSPNRDGINDILMLTGRKTRIREFEFKVIDRNGYSIYRTDDVDFTWQPGSEVPNGLYTYYMKLILDNKEEINSTGPINLVR